MLQTIQPSDMMKLAGNVKPGCAPPAGSISAHQDSPGTGMSDDSASLSHSAGNTRTASPLYASNDKVVLGKIHQLMDEEKLPEASREIIGLSSEGARDRALMDLAMKAADTPGYRWLTPDIAGKISHSHEEGRDRFLAELVQNLQSSASDAHECLKMSSSEEVHDRASCDMADYEAIMRYPESAEAFAMTIRDQEKRDSTLSTIVLKMSLNEKKSRTGRRREALHP